MPLGVGREPGGMEGGEIGTAPVGARLDPCGGAGDERGIVGTPLGDIWPLTADRLRERGRAPLKEGA